MFIGKVPGIAFRSSKLFSTVVDYKAESLVFQLNLDHFVTEES